MRVAAVVGPLVAAAAAVSIVSAPSSSPGSVALTSTGTVSGDATYSVNSVHLPNSTVTMRWNPCQARVTYKVNPALAGATASARSSAVSDVKEAFRRLSAATGITFTYTGMTSSVPTGTRWAERQSGAEIVVAWVRPTTSTLLGRDANGAPVAATGGYSYKTWAIGDSPWNGVIDRGFVVVNSGQQSQFRPGFGAGVTRGNLLLHELGHVVGLNHSTASSQLMYPTILSRASAGYRSGDRAGLSRVGAARGCIDVPAGVVNDL